MTWNLVLYIYIYLTYDELIHHFHKLSKIPNIRIIEELGSFACIGVLCGLLAVRSDCSSVKSQINQIGFSYFRRCCPLFNYLSYFTTIIYEVKQGGKRFALILKLHENATSFVKKLCHHQVQLVLLLEPQLLNKFEWVVVEIFTNKEKQIGERPLHFN